MSIPSHELFFEKISHYDRPQEPVTVGIPFPRGALSRAEQFALYDGAAEVYCQKSVTGSWDDGSIRWLLVHSLLDLPGGSGKGFRFAVEDETRAQPAPAAALTVVDGEQEVVLDTGPLQLAVGKPRADLIRSGHPPRRAPVGRGLLARVQRDRRAGDGLRHGRRRCRTGRDRGTGSAARDAQHYRQASRRRGRASWTTSSASTPGPASPTSRCSTSSSTGRNNRGSRCGRST